MTAPVAQAAKISAKAPSATAAFSERCAGLTESLLESELFGHVKGSFTGAYRDKIGKLQAADRGTLFLDEVGEMSLRMQALLLRFLEQGELQRVGADERARHVDVRIVAATNRNLAERVAAGEFREDLLYRLRVIHIHVPPLRERRADIRPLVAHFAERGVPAVSSSRPRRSTCSSAIAGPATSASSRTSSSTRSGSRTAGRSVPSRCRTCVRMTEPLAAGPRAAAPDRRRAVRYAGQRRLLVLVAHPSAVPGARHHAARHPGAGPAGPADHPRQLSRPADAVRDDARGLSAVSQFPGGARVQGGLPRVPHRRGDAANRSAGSCCRSWTPAATWTRLARPSPESAGSSPVWPALLPRDRHTATAT